MKIVNCLLLAIFILNNIVTDAQNFSGPKYAKWGRTSEDRKENILNLLFLKKSAEDGNHNAVIEYFMSLVEKCPTTSESIYVHRKLIEQTDDADRLTYCYCTNGSLRSAQHIFRESSNMRQGLYPWCQGSRFAGIQSSGSRWHPNCI